MGLLGSQVGPRTRDAVVGLVVSRVVEDLADPLVRGTEARQDHLEPVGRTRRSRGMEAGMAHAHHRGAIRDTNPTRPVVVVKALSGAINK